MKTELWWHFCNFTQLMGLTFCVLSNPYPLDFPALSSLIIPNFFFFLCSLIFCALHHHLVVFFFFFFFLFFVSHWVWAWVLFFFFFFFFLSSFLHFSRSFLLSFFPLLVLSKLYSVICCGVEGGGGVNGRICYGGLAWCFVICTVMSFFSWVLGLMFYFHYTKLVHGSHKKLRFLSFLEWKLNWV